MPSTYRTPGVYVVEKSIFPPSVAAVETAIPAFIGYTQKARLKEDGDLFKKPHRITSMVEYVQYFGEAQGETTIEVSLDTNNSANNLAKIDTPSSYQMYYSMQAFFANGGGPCYILAADSYANGAGVVLLSELEQGLDAIEKIDEVTLLVFPDALALSMTDYYNLQTQSLEQCEKLQDRFAVMDVYESNDAAINDIDTLRNTLSPSNKQPEYGAVYYPKLITGFDFQYDDASVQVSIDGSAFGSMEDVKADSNLNYNLAKVAINNIEMELPAAPAVVGVYAAVDNARGVWKAPANININGAIRPKIKITHDEQQSLNVHPTGKSINAIRSFAGRGNALIWGSRTLAGNDNEWRYVPVRRFFNMAEESIKKASEPFVFEPNDANTWIKVRSMIENFLTLQWRAGALAGATTEDAFFVQVGLGSTMTPLDILEGRMIVKIGMAVVRPAEFIILEFSHKMQES
ncbi:MAG: phage tail sheath family protein [Bacteroidota bacterium]